MQYENPEIPEGINTSDEHPLKELLILGSGILLVSLIIISLVLLIVEYSTQFSPFEYESTTRSLSENRPLENFDTI